MVWRLPLQCSNAKCYTFTKYKNKICHHLNILMSTQLFPSFEERSPESGCKAKNRTRNPCCRCRYGYEYVTDTVQETAYTQQCNTVYEQKCETQAGNQSNNYLCIVPSHWIYILILKYSDVDPDPQNSMNPDPGP